MEINFFPKFLDEAITPIAQSVGNTLSSIWTTVFGGIDIYAQKTQHKRIVALNKFKEELEQKVSSVPEEKLVEPPLHIVGPSIEASKYYFESDELRSMFANLIAASINIDTITKAHPSFVEIIKQLSPLDAKNLALFKSKSTYPIIKYRLILKQDKGGVDVYTNVFLDNPEVQNITLQASSLSNLNRVGLVDISYSDYLIAQDAYKKFEQLDYYLKMKNVFSSPESAATNGYDNFKDIEITKGKVNLTPLGKDFIFICLD